MGSTTAAPWSIPYPTGTDRVMDGDNAIQAVADRMAAILAGTVTTPWLALPFRSPWQNWGAPNQLCGYRRIGDIVYLRGLFNGGLQGTTVADLPVGYRPPANTHFGVGVSTPSGGVLAISTTGTITADIFPNGGWATLSNIQFSVS